MNEARTSTSRRLGLRAGLGAVALVALAAGCGSSTAQPQEVESCLRQEGLGVTQQTGLSAPVEAKVNFDIASGAPDPEQSGSVIFYASEDDARRNLESSGRSGPKGEIRQKGKVLYTPFGAQADGTRTAAESETLVESCVVSGEAGAADDSDKKKKKKKKKR